VAVALIPELQFHVMLVSPFVNQLVYADCSTYFYGHSSRVLLRVGKRPGSLRLYLRTSSWASPLCAVVLRRQFSAVSLFEYISGDVS
jgi:hypothetical protein